MAQAVTAGVLGDREPAEDEQEAEDLHGFHGQGSSGAALITPRNSIG